MEKQPGVLLEGGVAGGWPGICSECSGPCEALSCLLERGRMEEILLCHRSRAVAGDLMSPSPGTRGLRGQIQLSGTLESETEKPQG